MKKITAENTPLEFPCRFPVKAMGKNSVSFRDQVLQIISRHVEQVREEDVTTRHSSSEKFLSVTVIVAVDSRKQLENIYAELHAHEHVLWTL